MDAVLAVMDTHSEVIRLAEQDVDQLVAIRKNWQKDTYGVSLSLPSIRKCSTCK